MICFPFIAPVKLMLALATNPCPVCCHYSGAPLPQHHQIGLLVSITFEDSEILFSPISVSITASSGTSQIAVATAVLSNKFRRAVRWPSESPKEFDITFADVTDLFYRQR